MRFFLSVFVFAFCLSSQLRADIPPSGTCPILTKGQLCQISGGRPNQALKADPASVKLIKKACMFKKNTAFQGTQKGVTCECDYIIPPEWSSYLPKEVRLLSIKTRYKNKKALFCPVLTYRTFLALIKGHVYQSNQGLSWRSRKNHLTHKARKRSHPPLRDRKSIKVKPSAKRTYHFCIYHINNLPIILYKKISETVSSS